VVCPWLLHRHRLIWPKPDHFIPERFLPGGFRPTSKFAYIPFSVGARICTGMAFSLTEAILSIATIAQNYVLRLVPGHRVEVTCRLTLRPGERLPMQLVPRHAVEGATAGGGAIPAMQAPAMVAAGASDGGARCPYHGHGETDRLDGMNFLPDGRPEQPPTPSSVSVNRR
jgi:hypothetical protein